MGLFDMFAGKAINQVGNSVKQAVQNAGNKTERIVFDTLPQSYEQFINLPSAAMSTPFQTAAMTVLALCFYPQNSELSLKMLDFLRGPRPLNGADKQFIADRFRAKDYVPRSYFVGSTPENEYSYEEQGIAKLFISSGGADSPRPIKLRKAKDGKWYLWEQFLLTDIRKPESTNPWA